METLNMSSAMSIIVSYASARSFSSEFLLDFQELCLQGFYIIRKFLAQEPSLPSLQMQVGKSSGPAEPLLIRYPALPLLQARDSSLSRSSIM